jgi:hypothetical protein
VRFPGFIGPSYVSASVNVDCQRCVNLYPEMHPLGTGKEREVASLVPTPGLRLLQTIGSGPIRGTHTASNEEYFVVSGNKLYRVSSSWVATELGSLNTSSGPVSIADNGTHVVVVDGTYGYVWTISPAGFAQITDPDFPGADQVTYQDGYFLFNKPGTGQFFISGLNDVSFDALEIATAEGSPDQLVGLVSANQNVYLFGTQSTEVFYNSGDADFPFARIQGAIMAVGCAAPHSIVKVGGSVVWIGRDSGGFGIIYRTDAYQPQRISTPSLEAVIREIPQDEIGDARAWTYQQGGHLFYVLNLPNVDTTWVYDASTGLWHERNYLGTWGAERHRADCHSVAHGENVVGDYENGRIYALDPDTEDDNGVSIVRKRAAPHISKNGARLFHTYFQLDMETGVGTSTGQGENPQVMLRYSDDGGHSWSSERWADAGRIGARRTRVIFRRLGSSRDRVYEITIADPVKVVLIGAELGIEEGAS